MKITQEQYEKIKKYLPRQRGNVSMSNLQLVNAILYVTENGCKWRALPKSYRNWHTVYVRMNRWSKNGVLQRLFEGLQRENIIKVKLEAVCLDRKLVVPEENLQQKFIWSPHQTVRQFHSRSQAEMQAMDQKDENC